MPFARDVPSGRDLPRRGAGMEAIGDYSWFSQMLTGEVLERLSLREYRGVALRVLSAEGNSSAQYHFRLLLFHGDDSKPSAAFNLETSILGSLCYTEQIGHEHRNLGPATESLTYEEFRKWALERVDYLLIHETAQPAKRARRATAKGRPPGHSRPSRPKVASREKGTEPPQEPS